MDNYQSELLDKGYIYLGDDITDKLGMEICEKIIYLNQKKDKLKDIIMLINSPGGSVVATFSIVNIMEWSRIPVKTVGLGMISSGSFITFIAGKERTLTETTTILSHRYSWYKAGSYSELINDRNYEDRLHEMFVNHYMKYTKFKTKAEVEKYLLKDLDTWLTPEEAIKFGFADKVIKNQIMVIKK